MFENIGGKIKALAKIICWLGITASVLGGIYMFWLAGNAYGRISTVLIVYGVLLIVGGSLISWIGSFFTYGFGQLIENSDRIKEDTNRIKKLLNKD